MKSLWAKHKFISRQGVPLRRKISLQLIVINLVLIVIPLAVVSILSQEKYASLQSNAEIQNSKNTIALLNQSIDSYFEDIVTLSMLPMYDSEFSRVLMLSNEPEYEGRYDEEMDTRIRNFLFTINYLRNETESVYLYNNSKMVAYISKTNWTKERRMFNGSVPEESDFQNSTWFLQATDAAGKSIIVNRKYEPENSYEMTNSFSIAKILKNINTGKKIGAILIDVNLNKLKGLCESSMQHPYENLIIFDPYGQMIFSIGDPEQCAALKQYSDSLDTNMGFSETKIGGAQYLLSYHTGQYSGLKIVWSAKLSEVLEDTYSMQVFTRVIILIICAFLIVFSAFLSKMVFDPLNMLLGKIREMRNGNLNVRFDFQARNEIGVLADSFNSMVLRLNEKINEVYVANYLRKDAQLRALQYQINPHFLYNTLETIHMTAEVNGDYSCGEMITHLAQLFRYAVEDADEPTTVRDELENVHHYVDIMNLRLGGKLSYLVSCSDELMGCRLPKFTLQPIIENCMTHGFQNSGEANSIIVSVTRRDKDLLIAVVDNGVGMSGLQIEEMERILEDEDASASLSNPGHTVGSVNVHRRIRLMFGAPYGLKYASTGCGGTQVVITVPMERSLPAAQ